MNFQIVIDQREKIPLQFANAEMCFLKYGDYSIRGFEHLVTIERKSLNDAAKSVIGQDRLRFESNIIEAKKKLLFYAIVIEANLDDFYKESWYSSVSGNCVRNTYLKWSVKYGIPIFFCGDSVKCAEVVYSLLEGFLYYHNPYRTPQ